MNLPSSVELYDALAPVYREYSEKRARYIAAIDLLVTQQIAPCRERLLDVGAGDGVRGMSLSRRLGFSNVVLCDSSAEMCRLCRLHEPAATWQCDATSLPNDPEGFDAILCLWNVLGHMRDEEARVRALEGMSRLLRPKGRLFIDVNNRHNHLSYGTARVLLRRLIDFMAPDIRRGDTSFTWEVGGRSIPAHGHLFTPREIERLFDRAHLKVALRRGVDYSTGRVSSSSSAGQLFYVLERERGSSHGNR